MVQHGKILVKFKSKQELLDQNPTIRTNKPNPLQKFTQKIHKNYRNPNSAGVTK